MKKVLSLFLAVLMLFTCLSVSAAAEGTQTETEYVGVETKWHGPGKPATYEQVVIEFDPNGGTFSTPLTVFDEISGQFVVQSDITGVYTMVPESKDVMKVGYKIALPYITPPKNQQFDGWYCLYGPVGEVGRTVAGRTYDIPAGAAGTVMRFIAQYVPTKVEEDTMAKVMSILFRVFGTILGILLYGGDSAQGIAIMEKIFGSVFA